MWDYKTLIQVSDLDAVVAGTSSMYLGTLQHCRRGRASEDTASRREERAVAVTIIEYQAGDAHQVDKSRPGMIWQIQETTDRVVVSRCRPRRRRRPGRRHGPGKRHRPGRRGWADESMPGRREHAGQTRACRADESMPGRREHAGQTRVGQADESRPGRRWQAGQTRGRSGVNGAGWARGGQARCNNEEVREFVRQEREI